jgi:hypothetical protein
MATKDTESNWRASQKSGEPTLALESSSCEWTWDWQVRARGDDYRLGDEQLRRLQSDRDREHRDAACDKDSARSTQVVR